MTLRIPPCSVRLAWSLLALGCRSPDVPADRPPGAEVPVTSPAPAAPARSVFVVLTRQRTLVIPTDPALAVKTLPGWWVGDPRGSSTSAWGTIPLEATLSDDPKLPVLPVCPWEGRGAACEIRDLPPSRWERSSKWDLEELFARVEVADDRVGPARVLDLYYYDDEVSECPCVVVPELSTDRVPLDLDDPEVVAMIEASPHSPEQYAEICDERPDHDLSATSYLGGMLYSNGVYENAGCDGWDNYVGASAITALRPDAAKPTIELPEPTQCRNDALYEALEAARLQRDGGEECGDAFGDVDASLEAYALHRGRLVGVVGTYVDGDEILTCACESSVPVTPDLCPSVLDPCGQGTGLPRRDAWDELWVATDERLALARDHEGLVVLAPDRDEPLRREPFDDEILGVEYHPDAALLGVTPPPRTVRIPIPALHETDAKFSGSAKDWGNRCFAHLKAGRLDAAEAACFAGLLADGTDGTRGALTYNLGRIAEARGEPDRARAYYERSQRLRPNEATAKRLKALGGPSEGSTE